MGKIYQGLGIALSRIPSDITEGAFSDYTEPLDESISPMEVEIDDIKESVNYFKRIIGISPEIEKNTIKLSKEDLQKLNQFLKETYIKNIKDTVNTLQKELKHPCENKGSLAYLVKDRIAYMQPAIAFINNGSADLEYLSSYPYFEIEKMRVPVYAKTFFWGRDV